MIGQEETTTTSDPSTATLLHIRQFAKGSANFRIGSTQLFTAPLTPTRVCISTSHVFVTIFPLMRAVYSVSRAALLAGTACNQRNGNQRERAPPRMVLPSERGTDAPENKA